MGLVGLTAAGVSGRIHAHKNDRENAMEMFMLVAIAAVIYEGLLGNIGGGGKCSTQRMAYPL